jgi:hypothetical protein
MIPKTKMQFAGSIPLDANVEIVHCDANGRVKPIFQENALCVRLMKAGWLSPRWINSPYAGLIAPLLGYWTAAKDGRNLITDAGRAGAASRINGSGAAAAFTSIGIGTGTTAASVSDTALQTGKAADGSADSGVHALATASVTASRVTTTVTNDTAQLVGTITFTGTIAVTESGVFNADTNGTMIARQVFSAINVISGDTLQLTWKIKAA